MNLAFNLLLLFFAIAPVFDGIVTIILLRAYRQDYNRALLERLVAASALFTSSILLSFLAVNRLFELHVDSDLNVAALLAALILTSIPGLNWLYMYVTKKF